MNSVAQVVLDSDPFTALTLAPPGVSCPMPEQRTESLPAEFLEAVRDVIAKEVREYVSTSFSQSSGFR